ncbi:MAG TPA: glycosyltransferase [Edaphobacter sp.]|nr:glycosyltransferase [Edaphobacter sp.]
MKIAVITQYFPTSVQPWAGHSAYQTLRYLAQWNEVKVFYPAVRYPELLTPATGQKTRLDAAYRPGGVDVAYVPYPALPGVSRPLNGWVAAGRLLPHVRRFGPEIILNYVVYPDGYAALRVGKALKVPVVVTAIGSDLNRIPDPLCGALTRKTLRESDAVITVSGDLRKTAILLGADAGKSHAILNGCDTSIFFNQNKGEARAALGINSDEEVVAYVGRMDVRKGLRELIEAVSSLHERRPRLRCYLVGDGSDEGVLRELIAQKKAGEYVKLVPPCKTDGVAQWMAAADLVTLPSYKEGCPNVVLEALAAGRPVVASDVGGIPELMDDSSGRLVPAIDSSALAVALDEVLATEWSGDEIAKRHQRGWAEVARDVQGVLESVLAGHGQVKSK